MRLTRFDWPLGLYGLSLAGGAAIAYPGADPGRPLAFACAGLAVYYLLAFLPSYVAWRGRTVAVLRTVIAAIPFCLTVYFIVTNDWAQPVDKVGWQAPVRQWLAARHFDVGWPPLHPNLVGGVLAMWLPLQVAALAPARRRPGTAVFQGVPSLTSVLLFAASCAALLLSGLRGAWLALASASLITALWWHVRRSHRRRPRWAEVLAWAGGLATTCGLLAFTSIGSRVLALRPDRLEVWHNSWALATDYAFTGLGLAGFTMAYSSYALLVHVPHTAHAHNLYLDIWLAQGLVGLVAFAWLVFSALAIGPRAGVVDRHPVSQPAGRWTAAATVSLVTILVHGLLDDSYLGYGGGGVLLLFVPFALLARQRARPRPVSSRRDWRRWAPAMGLGLTLATLLAVQPAVRAQLGANLGTLSQTSAELSVFRWPEWSIQDAVRRAKAPSLDAAVQHYRQALEVDPANVTANRRLGQIEISMGKYQTARKHLEAAYRGGPAQRATRQLYGESLAVTGDAAAAVAVWQGLPFAENQLGIRRYWYESIHDLVALERLNAAIALWRNSGRSQDLPATPR